MSLRVDVAMPKLQPSQFIFKKSVYADDQGQLVEEREVVAGTPPADFVRFQLRASVSASYRQGISASKAFVVPLPKATTVQEAFAQIPLEYPPHHDKAVADISQEIERRIEELKQKLEAQANKLEVIPATHMPPSIMGRR